MTRRATPSSSTNVAAALSWLVVATRMDLPQRSLSWPAEHGSRTKSFQERPASSPNKKPVSPASAESFPERRLAISRHVHRN